MAELLRTARGVLLDLTDDAAVAGTVSDWTTAPLTVIAARCLTRPAPAAALFIRPDGYVAWAAASGAPDPAAGLDEALRAGSALPRPRASAEDQGQIPDFPNGPWLPPGNQDWGGKRWRSGSGSHWVRGS